MATAKRGAHALKVNKRTNRVKYFSVSFDGVGANGSEAFREAIRRRLSRQVRKNSSQFEITFRAGRVDWFITFQNSWPERDLDRDLNAVATEMGIQMFIEPGIPEREMTTDPSAYFFTKQLGRDRPTNG